MTSACIWPGPGFTPEHGHHLYGPARFQRKQHLCCLFLRHLLRQDRIRHVIEVICEANSRYILTLLSVGSDWLTARACSFCPWQHVVEGQGQKLAMSLSFGVGLALKGGRASSGKGGDGVSRFVQPAAAFVLLLPSPSLSLWSLSCLRLGLWLVFALSSLAASISNASASVTDPISNVFGIGAQLIMLKVAQTGHASENVASSGVHSNIRPAVFVPPANQLRG